MAVPKIGVQFNGLLEIRYSFLWLPHEKFDLSKALPTIRIERIQANRSATQCKSLVRTAECGCGFGRLRQILGISRLERNRPAAEFICARPIEIDVAGPGLTQGNNVFLCLVCKSKEEIETLFSKFSQSGKVTTPLRQEPFGTYGDLTDKFGIHWMFQFA